MPAFDKTLVLDLDRTLMFSEQWLAIEPDFVSYSEDDSDLPVYALYKRPGLDDFVKFCFENFEVGVWSSGPEDYVGSVCDFIFKDYNLRFKWSRDYCDPIAGEKIIKDIKKLEKSFKVQLSKLLVIDDNPDHYLDDALRNLIKVSGWKGDVNDDCLKRLPELLESMATVDDVRKVFWSNKPI